MTSYSPVATMAVSLLSLLLLVQLVPSTVPVASARFIPPGWSDISSLSSSSSSPSATRRSLRGLRAEQASQPVDEDSAFGVRFCSPAPDLASTDDGNFFRNPNFADGTHAWRSRSPLSSACLSEPSYSSSFGRNSSAPTLTHGVVTLSGHGRSHLSHSFNLSEGTFDFVLWLRLGNAVGGGGREREEALTPGTPAGAAAGAAANSVRHAGSSSRLGSSRRRGHLSSSSSSTSRRRRQQHIVATAHFPDGSSLVVGSVTARQGCWNRLHGGLHLALGKEGQEGQEGRERVGEGRPGSVEIRVRIADDEGGERGRRLRVGGRGRGKGREVEVWVTGASMSKISPTAWRSQQAARMKSARMRTVWLFVPRNGAVPRSVRVQVRQVESAFGFGAAVGAEILKSPELQEWILSRFDWAVFGNEMKWYSTNEGCVYPVDYSAVDAMLAFFDKKKVKVRGHTLFWDRARYNTECVQTANKTFLRQLMNDRMGIVERYKGRLPHWDVLNEPLNHHWFENVLGQSILPWMFQQTKTIDPNPLLFVNDFNILENYNGKLSTPEPYLRYIGNIRNKGGPITGIGLQGHFVARPNPAVTKNKLDQMSIAQLPIWITEADFNAWSDDEKRADMMEMAMREIFAHPAVQGMVFWVTSQVPCPLPDLDFGNCSRACNCCFTDHYTLNDNAMGRRYLSLRKEWNTTFSTTMLTGTVLKFSAFQGTYDVTLKVGDKTVVRTLSVPKGRYPLRAVLRL